jgi:perosamine synthetase
MCSRRVFYIEWLYSEEPVGISGCSSKANLLNPPAGAARHLTKVALGMEPIPLSAPFLTGREAYYVQDALTRGWLSGVGDYVSRFEAVLAARTGRKYIVAVANGTLAIELALRTLGVGSEVIVPAFTFAAPMLSVLAVGAVPIIVDIDPVTWTIDVNDASRRATAATGAIIAVDVLGHPCDYMKLERIGVPIIQDCAEAHGAWYRRKPVGSQGLLSIFSFHANKAISTGEGGSVGTDDSALAEQLRLLANHGMSKARPYIHPVVGRNYRMTNLTAAVGLAQVEAWDELIAARCAVADRYRCGLGGTATGEPGTADWATRSTWLHTITAQDRQEVVTAVRAAGIDARAVWPPLHRQPVLAGMVHAAEEHPVADRVSASALWLPTSAGMSDKTVDRVVSAVTKAVRASALTSHRPHITADGG